MLELLLTATASCGERCRLLSAFAGARGIPAQCPRGQLLALVWMVRSPAGVPACLHRSLELELSSECVEAVSLLSFHEDTRKYFTLRLRCAVRACELLNARNGGCASDNLLQLLPGAILVVLIDAIVASWYASGDRAATGSAYGCRCEMLEPYQPENAAFAAHWLQSRDESEPRAVHGMSAGPSRSTPEAWALFG